MRDDKWEMMLSWCFSKDLIQNSPSQCDGISADVEEQTRSQYCQFIRWMCSQFKLYSLSLSHSSYFCLSLNLNMYVLIQGLLGQRNWYNC